MRLLVSLLLISQISFAGGFAPRCERLFYQLPAQSHADSLGIERGKDLWSRFLYRKYLRQWSEKKTYTKESFETTLTKSYEILQQLQIHQGLIDNRSRDYTAKPEEVMRWAEIAVMREGLKSYLYHIPKNQKIHRRTYEKLARIIALKPIQFLIHLGLWTIPNKADKEIPSELLSKVLIDGAEAHLPDLIKAYKLQGQNKVTTYRRIQTALKYFSLTFTALMSFHNINAQIEAQAAQQKAEMNQQMDDLDKGLDQIDQLLDSGYFDPN